jgi:hypothetical protein
VDIAGAWNFTSSFIIQQLYGEVKYRCLGAMIGSKEIEGELCNPRLSSGNMLYSGSARPVPQVRVGIPEYTVIPGTRNWLAVKGYVAYGAFTDSNWQREFAGAGGKYNKNVMYHSKGGFLRIGNKEKFPVTLEGGLEMAAQFGGTVVDGDEVTKIPANFKDYFRVFFMAGGGSDSPQGEQTNVYGNHLGEWNFRLGWDITPEWNLSVYYQHFFEDHSQLFLNYGWKDGLTGVELTLPKNPVVSAVVYEYLYTKDQSGAILWEHTPEVPEQVSGRDNYYNHNQELYTGWQHWGMGIGNPLIISPIYNNDGKIYFKCNRVIGHHVGFEGQPHKEFGYRVLLSYTRGWGTYDYPYKEVLTNFNGLLELQYRPEWLKGVSAGLSFGFDRGSMLGHSYGTMLSIKKTGWL